MIRTQKDYPKRFWEWFDQFPIFMWNCTWEQAYQEYHSTQPMSVGYHDSASFFPSPFVSSGIEQPVIELPVWLSMAYDIHNGDIVFSCRAMERLITQWRDNVKLDMALHLE